MNVAIIGAGLIGKKRALALPFFVKLTTICDIDEEKGQQFAKEFGCSFEKDFRKVIKDKSVDAIFVCTTNKDLSKITIEAIKQKKHLLVEKPGARNLEELKKVYKVFRKNPVVLLYGYNHRFHPAITKAKSIIDSKKFGKILFIRAKYGHGGRLGYEKEWRFQKSISGGGELLDQGSHLIDLTNFFCGKMNKVLGLAPRRFWNSKLEDCAFFILKSKDNQVAHLSATWIEWKNLFCFEIMLERAKLEINGLGGSYGKEKLTVYKMKTQMGSPDIKEQSFNEDNSWKEELKYFFGRIKKKDYSDKSLQDAMYVLEIVEKIYKNSR